MGKYAVEILKRFNMLECKAMATPMDSNLKLLPNDSLDLVDVTHYRQIIESLMYLTNTRPDICFDLNTLSQYLVQPRRVHLVTAKHVMRYLKGTIDVGLYYDGSHEYRFMATQMQIGLSQTGKAHQVDVIGWDLL